MLIHADKHPHHTFHDCAGTQIAGVSSFDTETKEVTVALLLGKRMPADFKPGFKPLQMPSDDPQTPHEWWVPEISFVLPGAYAKDSQGEVVK